MNGFPIEKAKETMNLALDALYPSDTFNLITFAGDTQILFPKPVPATKANLRKAQSFLNSRSGAGGTEMMTAIKAALEPSDDQSHVRIVCFMTDGYVGNDMEIVSEVQKHQNARVFAFGIGESVNRFLLDKMAEAGRGEVEYVSLSDDGSAAARRFHERVRNPLLTDISIDWSGLPVADVYPQRIPDLFGAKPVVLTGRYSSPGRATIRLKGKVAGNDFVREIPVELPETMASHDVLASLWARARIDNLMGQDYAGVQRGTINDELKNTITQLGIEYRLMTQFTSFVAVEEMIITDGGLPRRIDVPVESPEGVTPLGEERENFIAQFWIGRRAPAKAAGIGYGVGGSYSNRPSGTLAPPPSSPPMVNVQSATLPEVISTDADRPAQGLNDGRRAILRQKVHPSILTIVDRVAKKETLSNADEAGFVRNGKAEVQVWLADKSEAVMAKLKELGFEVVLDVKTSQLIIGRISIDKLQTLAEQDFVKYLSPQVAK
jgi:Ca-activated chloride channel family protein